MSAITHLFAGIPVSDLDASIDWYTRFFGRPPDSRVGEEILWEIDERAWLCIEPNAAQAGAGRITLAVAGLDALLKRLAAQRIEHEPMETYSNGVRHVNIPDPDGNAIALAEPADAASASPPSAGPGASSQTAETLRRLLQAKGEMPGDRAGFPPKRERDAVTSGLSRVLLFTREQQPAAGTAASAWTGGYSSAGIAPPVWAKFLLTMRQRPSMRDSVRKVTKDSVPQNPSSTTVALAASPA
jgi:catechol 2,3-dioxygenase-like lactoylglutathione lyase family enzyme